MEKKREKNTICYFIPLLLLLLSNCAVTQPDCTKGGTHYCRSRGNFTGQWYDYYERALSCMEGECYEAALSDLNEAGRRRYADQRMTRTFGDHYMDYFPHREKGVIHYIEGRYSEAESELELSLGQFPSAKALFYLDEVRKKIMEQKQMIPSEPWLSITFPKILPGEKEVWSKDDPVMISGIAKDEHQYISNIFLADRRVYLESTEPTVEFAEKLQLDEGRHEIAIIARNLLGGKAERQIIINIDRSGPLITLKKFIPGVVMEGYVYDESGDISLFADEEPVHITKGKDVKFHITLNSDAESITLKARDKLGNETQSVVEADILAYTDFRINNLTALSGHQSIIHTPSSLTPCEINYLKICKSYSLLVAQNSSGNISDTEKVFQTAHGPVITLKYLNDQETVFKESINIEGKAESESNIEMLKINGIPIFHQPGPSISFNQFLRLRQGQNRVSILGRDNSGKTTVKNVYITRKTPEAFQLKHRYPFVIPLFDSTDTEQNYEQILFQYNFLSDVISRKRFQITIRREVEENFHNQGFNLNLKSVSGQIRSILYGYINETKLGVEIALILTDIEAEAGRTLATADVYHDHGNRLTSVAFAEALSEKFHRKIPLSDSRIIQIQIPNNEKVVMKPEKWIPEKQKLINNWPLLLYREKNPKDRLRGSDTEIMCMANIDESLGEQFIATVENSRQCKIGLNDKGVTQ